MNKSFVLKQKYGTRLVLSPLVMWYYKGTQELNDRFTITISFINGKDQWVDFDTEGERNQVLKQMDDHFGI